MASRPRRRFVLYSGGQERRNALIHDWLLALSPDAPGVRMTYIPVWAENSAVFFRRFERRYRPFGAREFDCLPVDGPDGIPPDFERRVMQSDIVYLAGGNTFYFLLHLRRSGLLPVLRRFAARGGVLAGLSAGALILTPHIGLAGFPPFDRDENEEGLCNLRGLNLVRFEFFPHFRRSRRYREALEAYSHKSCYPVYACPDGSGLVIEDDRFTAHGDVFLFHGGQMLKISP